MSPQQKLTTEDRTQTPPELLNASTTQHLNNGNTIRNTDVQLELNTCTTPHMKNGKTFRETDLRLELNTCTQSTPSDNAAKLNT